MPSTVIRRTSILPYFVLLLCWFNYSAVVAKVKKGKSVDTDSQSLWKVYPITLQLSNHAGVMWTPIQLKDTYANKPDKKFLFTAGARIDIGLSYVNETMQEIFDCFPKVGILGKYNIITARGIAPRGDIIGGIFYIEPNYSNSQGFEIVPRIGVGVASVYVPGGFYSGPVTKDEELVAQQQEEIKAKNESVEPFRDKEVSLNVIADLLFKFHLTNQWYINAGIGLVDWLPALKNTASNSTTDSLIDLNANKSLIFHNLSLSCGYTFNPRNYVPERDTTRKSRVDVSYVSGFRQIQLYELPVIAENNKTTTELFSSKKYYYVGGIRTQWTIQLAKYHGLVIGTEWVRDLATKELLSKVPLLVKNDIKASLLLGHEFLLGKLILGQYVGYYPLNAEPQRDFPWFFLNNMFYGELGIIFRVLENFHIGTSAHWLLEISPPSSKRYVKGTRPERINLNFDYFDIKIGYTF